MENQHRKISGYRELSQQEIDAMNAVKKTAETVGLQLEALAEIPGIDKRTWLSPRRNCRPASCGPCGRSHSRRGSNARSIPPVAEPSRESAAGRHAPCFASCLH